MNNLCAKYVFQRKVREEKTCIKETRHSFNFKTKLIHPWPVTARPWKKVVWKTIISYWCPVTSEGRAVKLRWGRWGMTTLQTLMMLSSISAAIISRLATHNAESNIPCSNRRLPLNINQHRCRLEYIYRTTSDKSKKKHINSWRRWLNGRIIFNSKYRYLFQL